MCNICFRRTQSYCTPVLPTDVSHIDLIDEFILIHNNESYLISLSLSLFSLCVCVSKVLPTQKVPGAGFCVSGESMTQTNVLKVKPGELYHNNTFLKVTF